MECDRGGMISPPPPLPSTSNMMEGEETMARLLVGSDVDMATTTDGVEDGAIVPIVPVLATSATLPEHPPKAIVKKEEAAAPATAAAAAAEVAAVASNRSTSSSLSSSINIMELDGLSRRE